MPVTSCASSRKQMRLTHIFIVLFVLGAVFILPQTGGSESQVNIFTEGDQMNPVLGADAAGDFVVVWSSAMQDDGLPGIYARQYYANGAAKGDEIQISSSWAPHENPAVAVKSDGEFAVTWNNYWIENQTSGGVAARIFNNLGQARGDEFQVNSFATDFQGEPDIAMDGSGNFVIVWQSWNQDGDQFGIFARLFNQNGTPLGSEFQVNTYTANDQLNPAVVMNLNGYFVITWSSYGQDGDRSGIYGRTFDRNGNPTSAEFRVNFTVLGWQEKPAIAMDALGHFIITWHSYTEGESSYDIFARVYETSTLKGPEFQVNGYSPDWQVDPAIAADATGNFMIAWQSMNQESESTGIFARSFDQYGQPTNNEIQINTTETDRQEAADILLFSDGSYNIVWQSRQNDESGWDIYINISGDRLNNLVTPIRGNNKNNGPKKITDSPLRHIRH